MRPIESKIFKMIEKDGLTFEKIEEIIDGTSRQELKKSFPDDCHFQSSKYFAKSIVDYLQRANLIKREGSKFVSSRPKQTEKKED